MRSPSWQGFRGTYSGAHLSPPRAVGAFPPSERRVPYARSKAVRSKVVPSAVEDCDAPGAVLLSQPCWLSLWLGDRRPQVRIWPMAQSKPPRDHLWIESGGLTTCDTTVLCTSSSPETSSRERPDGSGSTNVSSNPPMAAEPATMSRPRRPKCVWS